MGVGLSIRQPWVELILNGTKTVEVRTWPTRHRGCLWIHAGRTIEGHECRRLGIHPSKLLTGALVGHCDLLDCVPFTPGSWEVLRPAHLNAGPYIPKSFAWMLANPRRVNPVPMLGKLGLMRIVAPTFEISS